MTIISCYDRGLLSLDVTKLELKTITGTRHEKKYAESVLPIVKRHHLLLVTLLLFNSVSNESLPIFLGALFPNYVAILISVSAILIFGEILPSALFTGPGQLAMASYLTPLVWFLMTFFWPIAYPISVVLDWVFGAEEPTSVLSREEFQALVMLQGLQKKPQKSSSASLNGSEKGKKSQSQDSIGIEITPSRTRSAQQINKISPTEATVLNSRGGAHPYSYESYQDRLTTTEKYDAHLSSEELSIMAGVLKLTKQTVRDVMIPIQSVHMISDETILSQRYV